MKRNKQKILTVLLSCLLLLSGCINKEVEETTPSVDISDVNPSSIGSYQTTRYEYMTDVNVAWLTTNLSEAYLILANKQNELSSTYKPSSLEEVTCATLQSDRTYELEARTAQALYAMLAEMNAAGVRDVMVASAYRPYDYQVNTYNKYIEVEMSYISTDAYRVFGEDYIRMNYLEKGVYKLSLNDAHTVVQSYSALPGQSEHQTGLCVDFTTSEVGEQLTEDFENTAVFAWLAQNAYKFGFILRYPEGKESITGYTYEPWHYRFVGREHAYAIYSQGLCLEEYLK